MSSFSLFLQRVFNRRLTEFPYVTPCTEFKDVRKAWRKRKKEEAKLAAEAAQRTGVMDPATAEAMAWEAEGKWLAH